MSDPAEYSFQHWRENILGVFTYIDVTLFVSGVVLGVLWFVSTPAFALGLALLATMYWSVRSDADVHQASTHRLQIQEAMSNLLATTNVGQQLELLLRQIWHLFPIERAGVVLFGQEAGNEPVMVIRHDPQDLYAICAQPELLYALSKPREIRRIEKEPAFAKHCKLPVLLVPLHTSDAIVGAMVVVLQENRLSAFDPRFLNSYAAQATLAVMQARLINNIQSSQEQLIRAERLAAVGTLAAGVAHEFNNVLAIICNTADAAAPQSDIDVHRRALNIVSTTAKRGGSIAHGLLTFTRQIEPRRELVQIEDAIDPVLAMLEGRFRNEQIRLIKELSPVAPLVGDVGLLSQAVLNLVTNALDAMPTGGTLTIRLWQEQQTIHLSVQDTGQGIPDDIRAKLFEPFTTTKHFAQQTIGGNGLGLAITYGIVTSHSGTVQIESGAEQGTTMRISFPAGAEMPAPAAPAYRQLDGPLRVVVVDDEPLIGMALAQILEQDGHQVTWFDDPEQAIVAMEDEVPDLLIADIQMPKLDGLTLLREVKQQYPTVRQILITGQMYASQRSEVLALGAELIAKPFSATDIRAVLGQVKPADPATATDEASTRQRSAKDKEHMLREDLRHRLMNYVSSLEGMFRLSRRGVTDPVAQALSMRYFAQTIGELSVFMRAEQLLGLLDKNTKIRRIHPAPLRLDLLLEEVADWITAGSTNNERITVTVDCPRPLEICGDAKSLLAALLAALYNSRESIRRLGMGEHSIAITAAHDGSAVIVSVEDSGAGFSPSLLGQLNRELARGDGRQLISALQSRNGLSLGIALMARVARLHNGSVTFRNRQAASGACVRFTLPAQATSQPVSAQGVQTTLDAVAA
ncbi:MAG TPA: ATP-binding protein [Herpetosiphonaceae bacterium]